ncbi:hypothetical protein [Streptomyces sp. Root1310]|uniref:hypothetical protein n=1 Tax=Streptomyces sp. Root1310 TaxID=1736452 RepID=UPI000710BDB2|nr:hypothetical protein [Streptomyces sp. Root1310]KQX80615.1 hypothetical protein ASD48_31725 [Streptomyces sp. Root1310]
MRIRRAITIGALLLMSVSLTACGDDSDAGDNDGDGKSSASTGSGKGGGGSETASTELPEASDMATLAYFLNEHASCLDLKAGAEYDDSNYADTDPAWGEESMTQDPAWGIKERAVCMDKYNDANTLLLLSDMKKFQTSIKERNYSSILIGKDFAVDPGDAQTIQELKTSGLKTLHCSAEHPIPSGYKQEPALVAGCVLTDYYDD